MLTKHCACTALKVDLKKFPMEQGTAKTSNLIRFRFKHFLDLIFELAQTTTRMTLLLKYPDKTASNFWSGDDCRWNHGMFGKQR